MGLSRWKYAQEICDMDICPGDCDNCKIPELFDRLCEELDRYICKELFGMEMEASE